MKKVHISKSFTLVEILAVCLLSILILIGGYGLYIISQKAHQKNYAATELTQNARIALERISRDIRQTMEIVTVLPADEENAVHEIKFQDGHNFWPGPSSSPSPSPSATLINGRVQYITYRLDGSDLHRTVSHYAFPATPNTWVAWNATDGGLSPTEYNDLDQVKAESISVLDFWGAKNVYIHITVADGQTSQDFETQSLGRNIP